LGSARKNRPMRLKVFLQPSDEGGYTVVVPALPGCISEGDTREDSLRNIREAIELYLDQVDDDQFSASGAEQLELTV
jgi:predicted RNase H-like HicB family nuclease